MDKLNCLINSYMGVPATTRRNCGGVSAAEATTEDAFIAIDRHKQRRRWQLTSWVGRKNDDHCIGDHLIEGITHFWPEQDEEGGEGMSVLLQRDAHPATNSFVAGCRMYAIKLHPITTNLFLVRDKE